MMLDKLKILVVGGSGDIGTALCRKLLSEGALVHSTYCTNPENFADLTSDFGERLTTHKLDVVDFSACEAFGDKLDTLDFIPDVLIYNVGVTEDGPVLGMSDEQWHTVMDVNTKGALNIARTVVKYMSLNRNGKVFFMSSVAGMKGGRGQGNYAASKAALEALGRSLAVELARKNIMVNMIAPGVIESAMTKDVLALAGKQVLDKIVLGRPGTPEEVAAFVAHLCSREVMYITGQTFNIDGGFKL